MSGLQQPQDRFASLARTVAMATGTWQAFALAVALVLGWLCLGPFIGFSNTTYQLWINTITTVVTFLMVFLIQHAQNHDTLAMHAKLDEIIRAIGPARDALIAIEDQPETMLQHVRKDSV